MKVDIIGILSETSMHPGAESSAGVIDLPVAREVTTAYPVLTGSSLKGAFREYFEARAGNDETDKVFGEQNKAGDVSVSDGRILILPVRTLVGHYKWVTCPYILDRFFRDLQLAGYKIEGIQIPEINEGKAIYSGVDDEMFLEEIIFTRQESEDFLEKLTKIIKPLIYHNSLKDRLLGQLAIISDEEFGYFARYGLEVRARNKLNSNTKTSENLWYEECLPPDTLFYTLFVCRTGKEASLEKLRNAFLEKPYIQIGGISTICFP